LFDIFEAAFASRDWPEWRKALDEASITFGLVGLTSELEHDEQVLATETLVPTANPEVGAKLTVNSPIWIHGHRKVPATRPPGLGEHSEAVLREAGLDEERIRKLLESGAVAEGGAFPKLD